MSNESSIDIINGALPAQTKPIPVTTGANRDATILHWGSTGLTPGQIGVSSMHLVYHGGDTGVVGVAPAYHGI